MELSKNKFKAIIKANCYELCTDEEINKLKETYEAHIKP